MVFESMRLFRAHPPALIMRMCLSLVCGRYAGLSCLFVHPRPHQWCFVTDGAFPPAYWVLPDELHLSFGVEVLRIMLATAFRANKLYHTL